MPNLREHLQDAPLLIEGAMGTMLMSAGCPQSSLGERCNLENPDMVADIHRSYAAAGARIHFSNTFNGNRLRLNTCGLGDRCAEVNRAGAKLARSAAGSSGMVGGTIGPIGVLLEPLGTLAPSEAAEVFAEQAAALIEAGIDLFWIETMLALAEAEAAVAACRRAGNLPIAVTMTFTRTPRGFFTMMGHSVRECVQRLEAAGVAIVGANCQLGSAAMVDLAAEFKQTTRLPVAMRPNAGQPELHAGALRYPESAEMFADAAERLADLGVALIGGCCGTTPAFIAAATQRLSARRTLA